MTDYKKQADDFLRDTNTTLTIVEAVPQKSPLWAKKGEKHGINYVITLKNDRSKYTFDFWDSIHNMELIEAINNLQAYTFNHDQKHYQAERLLLKNGLTMVELSHIAHNKEKKAFVISKYQPKAYDILACLSPLYEDTLEDFCASFGYDEDSMTAYKTFEACKEQDRQLRKLFTDSQLEALAEIQ